MTTVQLLQNIHGVDTTYDNVCGLLCCPVFFFHMLQLLLTGRPISVICWEEM